MIRQIDEKIIKELKKILVDKSGMFNFNPTCKCSKCKQKLYDLESYVTQKMAEAVFANQNQKK